MTESVLTSIKKLLGIAEEYEAFDLDVMIAINSAIMTLNQLGIGPEDGYLIVSKDQTWADFLGDYTNIGAVKQFVHLHSKRAFDPPGNSFLVTSIDRMLDELVFRLNVQVDPGKQGEDDDDVTWYKGSVQSYSDLPTTNKVGDVYDILTDDFEHKIRAGDNVIWHGTGWDNFAGFVDLSGYPDETVSPEEIDEMFG